MFRRVLLAVVVAWMAAAQTAPLVSLVAARLTANGLKADVSFLASDALEGRDTPSRGLDIAAEFVAAQFRRAGLEPAGDDGYFQTARYFLSLQPMPGRRAPADRALLSEPPAPIATPPAKQVVLRNVLGLLRGSDPLLKDTYVLLTAHYDHLGMADSGKGDRIFNGANDDASGTASVIEIAGALAALPRPKRSIVFLALYGEEKDLMGSRYYVEHPVFPLARTVADINLEQLGRTDDVTGSRVGVVNVTGYDFSSITAAIRKAGEDTGIQVLKDEESSDSFYVRSDNQPFADAGIPSHTLSVGYIFPDYHKPGDEWPKLDYENMAKVDRAVALGVYRIADNPEAPRWNAANKKTERYINAREAVEVP